MTTTEKTKKKKISSPICLNTPAIPVSLSPTSHLRLSALTTQTTSPSSSLAPAPPFATAKLQNLPSMGNFGNQLTTVTPSLQNNDNMTDNICNNKSSLAEHFLSAAFVTLNYLLLCPSLPGMHLCRHPHNQHRSFHPIRYSGRLNPKTSKKKPQRLMVSVQRDLQGATVDPEAPHFGTNKVHRNKDTNS
uniref:Uncharacterized protein n=1 Tax=Glossina pallidipes TaxID=7398 RepID=A0A1A9ZYU3_GLOPL